MSLLDCNAGFAAWFAACLYGVATLFLAIQGLHSLWMLLLFLRHRHAGRSAMPIASDEAAVAATVLVQLPVYNERDVLERLVAAVGALDWPRDRLRIQLLDDSTDDSVELGARAIRELNARGTKATYVHRSDRVGFKAGALAAGLELDAREDGGAAPFVAIFDADFVPESDFLRRAVPVFAEDAQLAFVQGRWEHINPAASFLTAAQALGIDGHFAIEQAARSHGDLPLNFNGTCGVWRRSAIEASGGWQHDTLTEDLDLSYRAHLHGYRARYRIDLAVPGELPPTLEAWRGQQARWAMGSIQTARKLLPDIWASRWSLRRKVAASLHLLHYLVHPAILVTLLLAPFASTCFATLPPVARFVGAGLMACGFFPPILLYIASQRALRRPWRSLLRLPLLMSLGTGIAVSNSRAALRAIAGKTAAFVRTPKSGGGVGSYKALPATGIPELLFALWGAYGIAASWTHAAGWVTPLLFLYVCGLLLQGVQLLAHRLREALTGDAQEGRSPRVVHAAGIGAVFCMAALVSTESSWREAPLHYSAWGLALGVCYLVAVLRVRTARLRSSDFGVMVAVALVLHCLATGLHLSDDVYRYRVEGAQVLAGENPYQVAPAHTLVVGAEPAQQVNHAEMTAIYPPAMLFVHAAVVAAWPSPVSFRVLALVATFVAMLLALGLLLQRRISPKHWIAFAWSPVLLFFSAGEAHHDIVAAAALLATLLLLELARPRAALVALSVAILLKPFAAAALPFVLQVSGWRRIWIPCALCVGASLPFVGAGAGLFRSLASFGGSMHFHGPIEPVLRFALGAVVPASSIALVLRVVLAGLFVGGIAWLYARSRHEDLVTRVARATALLLLCLPTLHPWYFVVVVALLPFVRSRALPAWTAATALYWLHGVVMPEGAPWAEWPVATALAHLPFLAWMLCEAFGPLRVLERTAILRTVAERT